MGREGEPCFPPTPYCWTTFSLAPAFILGWARLLVGPALAALSLIHWSTLRVHARKLRTPVAPREGAGEVADALTFVSVSGLSRPWSPGLGWIGLGSRYWSEVA